MMVSFKDLRGNAVVVNTRHLLFIGQAGDEKTQTPIMGRCVLVMTVGKPLLVDCSVEDAHRAIFEQARLYGDTP